MIKKSKLFVLALVLLLAFAQAAPAALTAVGPTNPENGFPFWYRDSLGQTVTLSVPPNAALSIPDPVIPGNDFSAQIGFGSEAMYWWSQADLVVPGGQALLVLALEAAFGAGDAAPGDQIVFARVRIRIDTAQAGDYTVTHPYGTKTYTNVPAGVRAINDTIDIGIGSPGDFTGALNGQIGPFLKQVGAPAGTLGDGVTLAPVENGPNGNSFSVVGPGVNASTDQFITGAELFAGTPFTIKRTTYSKDAGGAFAEVFVDVPPPFTPGTRIVARVRPDAGVPLTRSGLNYFARFPFTQNLPTQVIITGKTNGANETQLRSPLKDSVTVTKAEYSLLNQTLTLAATSSDVIGPVTLRATGWAGAPAPGQVLNAAGADTVFAAPIPPASVPVTSDRGGTATLHVSIVP
jgi:hypothetical protein